MGSRGGCGRRRSTTSACGARCAALTNDVTRRTRLRVERGSRPGLPALDPEEELVVYRVAQEALTNVAAARGARPRELALGVRDGRVELAVTDDGAGFEPGARPRAPACSGCASARC